MGRCQNEECAHLDGEMSQLWPAEGAVALLCWFCWREWFGAPTNDIAVTKYFGAAFAEEVALMRAIVRLTPHQAAA